MNDYGKLKDGTPIDGKFLIETVYNDEQTLWNLLTCVVRAFPHLREEIQHNAAEHKRIHNDLCNELRKRVADAKVAGEQA